MSKINVNTLSNELENGGPDFSHMPTVAGDPVVESGSNSDGEWTRWADGTQVCQGQSQSSIQCNVISYGSGAYHRSDPTTLPFPIAFSDVPHVTHFSCDNAAGATWVSSDVLPSLTHASRVFALSNTSSATTRPGFVATGRWK